METAIRKTMKLKSCPKCGGDVCRTRDTFGVYHQCAQCGREIRIGMNGAPLDAGLAADSTTGVPAHPTAPQLELMV